MVVKCGRVCVMYVMSRLVRASLLTDSLSVLIIIEKETNKNKKGCLLLWEGNKNCVADVKIPFFTRHQKSNINLKRACVWIMLLSVIVYSSYCARETSKQKGINTGHTHAFAVIAKNLQDSPLTLLSLQRTKTKRAQIRSFLKCMRNATTIRSQLIIVKQQGRIIH